MKKVIGALLVATAAVTGLSACSSQADTVSYNLSQEAEQFQIERRITVINGITDDVMMEIEGRCSVETSESQLGGSLEITCKIADDAYVKHFAGLSDNVTFLVQQLDTADASVYHHIVLIKPENLLPEFVYDVGEQ